MMGTATAGGENAVVEAARQAISCPLLEDTRITGSRGILINISGSSSSLGLHEVNEACSIIREAAGTEDVQINFGITQNESLGDTVKVTVIATGFQPENLPVFERPAPVTPFIRMQPEIVPAREPEPVFMPEPIAPEPEPEPAMAAEAEPMMDLDDLDTPAYLRQGRLLN
jgi:cell division protein FtsZ